MIPTAKEILFSTGILFGQVFCFKWIFFKGSIFPGDFVRFKDISRNWKINLLFSRFFTTCGNPDYL